MAYFPTQKDTWDKLQNNPNTKHACGRPGINGGFIDNKQAIILGLSDVHILGNCCDVFLDTFPFPCGFSAIEIMSKGKPVVSINQPNLSNYKKSRVNKLILENEDDLNGCLIKLENNSKFYNEMSQKSLKIAKDYDNSLKLAESIASL